MACSAGGVFGGFCKSLICKRIVWLSFSFTAALSVWHSIFGCDFFKGVVMKRAYSPYPVQFRSAIEEFRGWCKHRFLT